MSTAGMSLNKLSLAGNYLIIPGKGKFGKWHPGSEQENENLFNSVKVGWSMHKWSINFRSLSL